MTDISTTGAVRTVSRLAIPLLGVLAAVQGAAPNIAATALEEGHAELRLERGHGLAHGRLREAKPLRGSRRRCRARASTRARTTVSLGRG